MKDPKDSKEESVATPLPIDTKGTLSYVLLL